MSIFDNIFNSVRLLGPVHLLASNIFHPVCLLDPVRLLGRLEYVCYVVESMY